MREGDAQGDPTREAAHREEGQRRENWGKEGEGAEEGPDEKGRAPGRREKPAALPGHGESLAAC